MAISPSNIGWNQVNKKVTKATRKVIKTADEYMMPKTPADVAFTLLGLKGARVVGGIAKKGAKHVAKAFRNIG
jgi:hypothetical protein